MATDPAATPAVDPAAKPAVAGKPRKARVPGAPPKSQVRTLTAGKDSLVFRADIRNDGSVDTYISVRELAEDGKSYKSTRGASAKYKSLDEANKATDAAVAAAVKNGWTARAQGAGGYKPRPDAFGLNNLPKPRTK